MKNVTPRNHYHCDPLSLLVALTLMFSLMIWAVPHDDEHLSSFIIYTHGEGVAHIHDDFKMKEQVYESNTTQTTKNHPISAYYVFILPDVPILLLTPPPEAA